jgi:vacuolar-type H+-ATPase subunit F/Vma7
VRIFVIGDEDTVVGFRHAGVAGAVVRGPQEAAAALAEALKRSDAVIIMPKRVADMVRDEVDRVRYSEALPLIVEVPCPEGAAGELPSLFRLIRESVGVKF